MLAYTCASGFGVVLRELLCVSGQLVENKGSCKSSSRHIARQGLTWQVTPQPSMEQQLAQRSLLPVSFSLVLTGGARDIGCDPVDQQLQLCALSQSAWWSSGGKLPL